jgi:succinoglycan biosynthesis transport protein ExoP
MWGNSRSARAFGDSLIAGGRRFRFPRLSWPRQRSHASTGFRFLAQRIGADYPPNESGRLITLSSLVDPDVACDTTLMLAWYIVEELRRDVLVIDGGFADSAFSRRLGFEDGPGLTELLRGKAELDDVLQSARDRVWILPAGTHPPGVAANFPAERISEVLNQARERFAYVLLEHGPIRSDTRYLAFAAEADLVLLLAEEGRTRMSDIEESQSLFGEHRITDVRLLLATPSPGRKKGRDEGLE